MSTYVICDATGKIVQAGFCPDGEEAAQAALFPGATILVGESADVEKDYVSAGVVTERASLPSFDMTTVPADGATPVVATGLPNPTSVTIRGAATDNFSVTDGTLALTFDTAGLYVITLDAGVAYLPKEERINAA